jgi:hypothetical protein
MRLIISLLVKSFSLFAAAFIVLTTGVQANSQPAENWDRLFAPYLLHIGPNIFDQNKLPKNALSEITQDNNPKEWMAIAEGPPLNDLQWRSFGLDYDKIIHSDDGVKTFQGLSSISGSTYSTDQYRLGDSYFGIQTEKATRTPEKSGRSDCTTDDECADYSGLPKPKLLKTTTKNVRKPFIGLSITTPLQ